MPEHKHIAITGAVSLTSVSKIQSKSSSNTFKGSTENKLGGDGFAIAQSISLENPKVDLLTALNPNGVVNQLLSKHLENESFLVSVDYDEFVPESTENVVFNDNQVMLHIKNEAMLDHIFDIELLDKHIRESNLLITSTEISKHSLVDAVNIANKYKVPVFILLSSTDHLSLDDLIDIDFDYLFLSQLDASQLQEQAKETSLSELSSKIGAQLVINNQDDGMKIADQDMVLEVDIECIVHKDMCIHVHLHLMSYMAHLINTGVEVEEAVLSAVEEIEDYIDKHKGSSFDEQTSLEESFLSMQKDAFNDAMTNVLNRRGLEHHIISLDFSRNDYIAAILDIDNFKQVNDVYGHPVGDEMIKYLSKCLQTSLRPSDLIARWGGEEFVIIFTANNDEDFSATHKVLERVRLKVNELAHDSLNGQKLSVSIGAVKMSDSYKFEDELELADKALYLAKKSGKNCVKIANIQ
jgi:diguanylate cyclase (GGDEF)-like protein